jgi:pimeloyl-ACP methyl ester carboxylesterase
MPPAKSRPATKSLPPKKPAPEVVDPIWLLKALGFSVVGALICAYATLCLLFYQGAWQLVLHPSHAVDRTPEQANAAFTSIRFDAADTGQPRLTGWWIPASESSALSPRYAAFTVLYLHDGSGSLADTVPALARLHAIGINVFAFDYRGFGASDASSHPSFESMTQDSEAAFECLTSTRHLAGSTIIPYGTGLGAPLAAHLALTHADIPAVIIDNPDPDPPSTAVAERPSHIVPVRMLFGSQFDIATPVAALKAPKLLIAGGPNSPQPAPNPASLQRLFQQAPSPRFIVTLPAGSDNVYQSTVSRFLDQYLIRP